MHGRKFLVDVVGNIGAGKSTLLRATAQLSPSPGNGSGALEVTVLPEPIEQWRQRLPCGSSPLQLMYDDPDRHGYAFQMFALHTRLGGLLSAVVTSSAAQSVIVCERSCASRKADVFGDLMRERMSDLEWLAYDEACVAARHALDALGLRSDLEITAYLRCAPETCLQRVRGRGRKEEEHLNGASIERLHQEHEARFGEGGRTPADIILEADSDTPEALALELTRQVACLVAEGFGPRGTLSPTTGSSCGHDAKPCQG
jgi:deoxyadenosine/deoxycytidine kinase